MIKIAVASAVVLVLLLIGMSLLVGNAIHPRAAHINDIATTPSAVPSDSPSPITNAATYSPTPGTINPTDYPLGTPGVVLSPSPLSNQPPQERNTDTDDD